MSDPAPPTPGTVPVSHDEHLRQVEELRQRDPADELAPGITVADLLDLLEVPPPPPGATFDPSVVYGCGSGRDLTMQIYAREDTGERRAAVVFVHGGAWAGGNAYFHTRDCAALAADGYVAATIEYRLYPEAPWPAMLEDAKCAVRFLRTHASRFGADADRIVVAGGSAGGHIAAMTALTPGRFEGSGGWADEPSHVAGAVLWYPMTDMRAPGAAPELREIVAAILGETDPVEASPVSHVNPGAPPILTMTGDRDSACPLPMIKVFHDRLEAGGVRNELVVFEGYEHGFDTPLSPFFVRGSWQQSFDRLQAFVASVLGSP